MKVFVLCPATTVTGGPEALHQLHDAGARLGFDMNMVYHPIGHPDPVPKVFEMYRPRISAGVADAPDSVVIAPETQTLALMHLRRATQVVYWLSVDNFVGPTELARLKGQLSPEELKAATGLFDPQRRCVHLAQSEYARGFVAERGGQSLMVTDYIRDEIVDQAQAMSQQPKENVVAYNPKKGMEFTKQLMALSPPEIQWVPIINMTPREVAALLGRAKVYIDFGGHPGRDRIPREAALCGCVVITGTQGSAGNLVDLPIPVGFKIDERMPLALPLIMERIREAMLDYPRLSAQFEPYRAWIRGQKADFMEEVFMALSTLEAGLAANRRRSVELLGA